MESANRVVLNTGFLYVKMLISMLIALYSTRLVLNALGATDYGIFNLVGGIIAMLSFLNVSMSVSTQRFLSFHIGSENREKLKNVFKSSVILHLIIGLIVVIGLELCGLFLFDGFLNIPPDRIETAKLVFHYMVLSAFFTINAVPYDASINAHENMLFDAIVGICESLLKLGIAIWLTYYDSDRLLFYAALIAGLTILIRVVKSTYCYKKYPECKVSFDRTIDRALFSEMFSFASWNMFGSLAGMGRNQGLAVILNLFFGTVVNAAYGIANQVASQLSSFSGMMLKAINPQIMKSEGAKDRERMLRLSMMSSKLSFFLLALFAIPCIFEMREILTFWLSDVPEYTVIFCDLILVATLTNQLTIGLQSAFQATGIIKMYQSVVGSLLLLNLPIAYLLLKFAFPAYAVLVSYIIIESIACMFRLFFLKKIANLSIRQYLNRVILCEITPVLISMTTCFLIVSYINIEYRFLLTGVASALFFSITIYYTGLYREEKEVVLKIWKKVTERIKT